MSEPFTKEFKLGVAVALGAIVVGLLPITFSMSPLLLSMLRGLCGLLTIAALVILADVAGWRRLPIQILTVTLLLTGVAYLSYRLGQRSQRVATNPQQPGPAFLDLGHLFLGYGADAEHTCHAVFNGPLLIQWSNNYRLALVCGVSDPTIDQFSNKHITVSSLFNITPSAIDISAQHRPETAKVIQRMINAQLAIIPKGARKQVGVEWSLWYRPVLLPPNVTPSDIRKLSDVAKLDGVVVPEQRDLLVISKH